VWIADLAENHISLSGYVINRKEEDSDVEMKVGFNNL